MGRSERTTSVVKLSEGLSDRVFIVIRGHIDQMKFGDCIAASFIVFLQIPLVLFCINVYMAVGESNGKLPPSTCPGCSVPQPYRSHDWTLVPANPASKAEY